jgi:hypothetical protein
MMENSKENAPSLRISFLEDLAKARSKEQSRIMHQEKQSTHRCQSKKQKKDKSRRTKLNSHPWFGRWNIDDTPQVYDTPLENPEEEGFQW